MLHVRGENDIQIPCEEKQDACDLTRLSVTENGIYMPDEADGYYQVDVNVPGVSQEDNGKVVVDGQLVDQTSRTITQNGNYDTTTNDDITVNVDGYPEPTGTINITQNGTSNVKDYASANVNVPNTYTASDEGKVVSSGALVAQTSQTVTQNGTYDTTTNDEVIVNVSGGGSGSKRYGYSNVTFKNTTTDTNIGDSTTGHITSTIESPTAPSNTEQGIYITNTIDLTSVDSISFVFNSFAINTNSNGGCYVGCSQSLPSSYAEATAVSNKVKVTSATTYTIDTTNLSGSYYVWCFSKIGYSQSGYCRINFDILTEGVISLIPKTITQNGTYEASDDNADGYSEVVVNVSGGAQDFIKNKSIITATDIVTEFEALADVNMGSANGLSMYGAYSLSTDGFKSTNSNILYSDLEAANTSATIYAVIKALTNGGDYAGISFCNYQSSGNMPLFYTRSNLWRLGTYSNDADTGYSSTVYRVLALAVDNSTKTASFYVDGTKLGTEKSYSNSGRYGGWGGGYNGSPQLASNFSIIYGALVRGVETSAEIISNCQAIANMYSDYLGQ